MVGLPSDKIALLLGTATPQQLKDIDRVIDECLAIAEVKFPLTNGHYVKPTVTFNLKGTTAGQAWPTKIKLNSELLHNPELYPEMITQTLPHEVAHCIVFQKYGHRAQAHGYEWRSVMRALGIPAKRTHNMPAKKARVHKKFRYECKGCGHKLTFGKTVLRRLNEGTTKYSCNHCGTRIPQGLGTS